MRSYYDNKYDYDENKYDLDERNFDSKYKCPVCGAKLVKDYETIETWGYKTRYPVYSCPDGHC